MTENRLTDYLGYMLEATQVVSGLDEVLDKVEFIVDKHTRQVVIFNLANMNVSATNLFNDSDMRPFY